MLVQHHQQTDSRRCRELIPAGKYTERSRWALSDLLLKDINNIAAHIDVDAHDILEHLDMIKERRNEED